MEIDVVPISYVTNGATRLLVRVVGDLVDGYEETFDCPEALLGGEIFRKADLKILPNGISEDVNAISKGDSYDIIDRIDIKSYRPRIEGDLWYLSELDLQFLQDGTGVLGVGSCGEPYPTYVACLEAIRSGGEITIRRQDTFPDEGVVLVSGFMVMYMFSRSSPTILTTLVGLTDCIFRTNTRIERVSIANSTLWLHLMIEQSQ